MVVYVMQRSQGHAQIRSRHVDVMFPRESADQKQTTEVPTMPDRDLQSSVFLRGSQRFLTSAPPRPLVSSEWMTTLVQFVASQKKIIYDSAREELGHALKQSIPMEMREILLRQSDVQVGGITKVGQVPEPVSTHLSLTSQMSMRRLQQHHSRATNEAATEADPFMDVAAHYISEEGEKECEPAPGRLEALVSNAMLQVFRSLRNAEADNRARLEHRCVGSLLSVVDFVEVERRTMIIQEQAKEWNRVQGREVGDYLSAKRREQTSMRNSTVTKAAAQLKAEKDSVRRTVQAALARETQESEKWVDETERIFQECAEELPSGPNTTQIDAEVARLILRERREKTEYFPDVL